MLAKSPFKDLKWTGVGPMRPSGRMTDVEAHPSQPEIIYAAAAQRGVWKSTDDGVTWTGSLENYPTASIGDLAIAPCQACCACRPSGECVQTDDMEDLFTKMKASSVWVLGTPVYWSGPTAQL